MAYNQFFPNGYQPAQVVYPTQPNAYPTQPNALQNGASSITWVQGIAGAKSYLVAPNSTVTLWDSESPSIYVKSADASGLPRIRIFDYVERTEERKPEAVSMDYAPISDFENLKSDVEEIKRYLKSQRETEIGKEKVK